MGTFLVIWLILSFTVWTVAPIRQIGQKYFMYFLILIAGDIITLFFRYALHSRTNVFYIFSGLLCLVAIQQKKNSNLFRSLILIISAATFIVEYFAFGYKGEFILISLCDFLLFYKFFQQSYVMYNAEKVLSIFLGFLSFYQLISVTKLLGFITDSASAASFFKIATSLQILIGIFFCIFKESDPRLLIKIK
ncbi:MAG: hypothetical protein WCA84_17710 [Ignavibacteriaceae bacterium]|jgi:hypothetical protein